MYEDGVKVLIHPEGYVAVSKGLFTKKISIKDFASVVNSLVSQEDQVIENSTFKYPESIHSVIRTNQGYIANLYYAGREAELNHTRVTNKCMVYMPNVMIRVELNEITGKPGEFSLGSIRWFCTDKNRASLGTDWPNSGNSRDHIWTLPFPNMYSDGRMCTGGNRLPSVIYQDWTILDMLYNDVLIGSPFNNDLTVPSLLDMRSGDIWISELHNHWKDEESDGFPYELLKNY